MKNTIMKGDRSRSTHIDGTTIGEPVLKGTYQVYPSEFSWRRRGPGGHAKEGIRSMATKLGEFDSDLDHLFDGGPTPTLSKVFQDRVEEK